MNSFNNSFIHLRVHSTYSIRDGLARPEELTESAKNLGYEGIALTDRANLFGAVKFCNSARAKAMKPVLGMTLQISDANLSEQMSAVYEIVVLAKNKKGYANLMQLSTYAQTKSADAGRRGTVPYAFFSEHCQDLIVLGGWLGGDVGLAVAAGDHTAAKERLRNWQNLCGDNYYMELQRLGEEHTAELADMLKLAKECSCPPVATNDVMFLRPEDDETHRLRIHINLSEPVDRENTSNPYNRNQYLRSRAEMEQLFAEVPAALENAGHIFCKCSFILKKKDNIPRYSDKGSADRDLAELANTGMEKYLGNDWKDVRGGIYGQRLQSELEIIAKMRYSDYFLIVSDFVRWAKGRDIPVGPGRGSGAGSLVAYATEITGLDPLQYDLLFERFLNEGRGSMPDFDIDVCMERREEVIAYIRQRYGDTSVAQIISFGTLGARAAIRDLVRILKKPYGLGDKIVDMIVGGPHIKLAEVRKDARLSNYLAADAEADLVYQNAMSLEGQVRHTGLHAAGVVITTGPVADSCPLYCDEDGKLLTQFDKDDLESIGLVKFDVLGLRTLTLIDHTIKAIAADGKNERPVLRSDKTDDPKVFAMICRGATRGVFQLESSGMRNLAERMRPSLFEDIVSLIALFRPGPMDLIDEFIENKAKTEKGEEVAYLSDSVKDVLKDTYGITLYQEQVMQIAQIVAGFSLTEADVLRYVMSKKVKEIMPKLKERFIKGALKNNYKAKETEEIFWKIDKFSGYGFNRSHAVGYGVLAYWTAYLKCHYPAQFMAAALSLEENDLRRTSVYVDEVRRLKLEIVPPDINLCSAHFIAKEGKIFYGLSSIKGLGRYHALEIVKERANGPYKDLFDLSSRVSQISGATINKRVLENLIRVGAFNRLDANQERLMRQLSRAIQLGKKQKEEAEKGLTDMFAETLDAKSLENTEEQACRAWSEKRAMREEQKALGFDLRYDPFKVYAAELRRYVKQEIRKLTLNERVTICGLIYHRRYIMKNERPMIQISLRDNSGEISIMLMSNIYAKIDDRVLKEGNLIALKGKLSGFRNSERTGFDVETVFSLADLRTTNCDCILLHTEAQYANSSSVKKLQNLATKHAGNTGLPLFLQIRDGEKDYRLRLFKQYHVHPEESFFTELEAEFPFFDYEFPLK